MSAHLKNQTVVKLQECSLGIEHQVIVGQAMQGLDPVIADPTVDPTYNMQRHVLQYAAPADGVMGLIDPNPHANSNVHPFLIGVHLILGAAVTWEVFLTAGLESIGSPSAAEVHDPDYDVSVASGTGTEYVKLGYELMPGQRVRVVCAAAAAIPTRAIARFCNTVGAGGRLVT